MYKKPARYVALEETVWQNLNRTGILTSIHRAGKYPYDISNYVGVKFYDDFEMDTRIGNFVMEIKICITDKEQGQPVTPKIRRLTENPTLQRRICAQIWERVSEDDIKFLAQPSAEEYFRGDRWMDDSKRGSLTKFLHAVHEAHVELIPDLARYLVYLKG